MTHFIGINGIGMSALARILLDRGSDVSGSDRKGSSLSERGARIVPQDGGALKEDTRVVYSSAIAEENPELVQAKALGCPLLHRSDLLNELARGYKALAVTGTHGKTTVSAMLAHTLDAAGLDPAFAIGGILPNSQCNGRHGDGDYFVLEADESDGTFVKYHPYAAIVTNIEADHLDAYGSLDEIYAAFDQFIEQTGLVIWCGDDPYLSENRPKGISYGFSEGCDVRAVNFVQKGFSCEFEVDGQLITIPSPGKHNALNALGVYALCRELGIDWHGLSTFPGVGRRLEQKSANVYDDYAHHPTEVRATLSAMRAAIGERRLIACFQPHRYTRLKECIDDFSFEGADKVLITEVFSAGEEPIEGIHSEALCERTGAEFIPQSELVERLKQMVRPHDVIVTMGAGDITAISNETFTPNKLKVAVLCGGDASEYRVSMMSADFFMKHLDRELYQVEQVVMDEKPPIEALRDFDLVFPVLHGPCEDGRVAAVLEMIDVPYVGCTHRAGAISMDKALTKRLVASHGIATPAFVELVRKTWDGTAPEVDFPVYVKPSHLGSTEGVTRVECEAELIPAIEAVFQLDDRLIVEQAVDKRDAEFGILGDEVIGPSIPLIGDALYTYEGKYVPPGAPVDHTPDLPQEVLDEGRRLAKQIFDIVGCRTLARIDFLLDPDNKYWFNEVNPFPGCTPLSVYPNMLAAAGITGREVCDRLVIGALRAYET